MRGSRGQEGVGGNVTEDQLDDGRNMHPAVTLSRSNLRSQDGCGFTLDKEPEIPRDNLIYQGLLN